MSLGHFFRAGEPAIVAALGMLWLAPAHAESASRPPDPNRGAVIATQGTAAGAPACAQCHAFNDASNSSGGFPRIAGQSAFYLAQQLRDFGTDVRSNAIMSPIAKALSPNDVSDLAAYYAGINAAFLPLAPADPALIERGRELAKVGSAARGIQSCDNCHGPGGVGEPPAIPYLAGQYGHYIAFELQVWQRGLRKSSADAMAVVAKKLDDEEVAAVAAYYQQVRTHVQSIGSTQ